MARLQTGPRGGGSPPRKAKLPLPDPKSQGPFQPFACDPGRSEAWWWLGIPIAAALFIVGSYAVDPDWNGRWMTGESGILETAQFVFMVIGLAIVCNSSSLPSCADARWCLP
jgi:hypothetical protein